MDSLSKPDFIKTLSLKRRKRKVGKVSDEIIKIQRKEKLTLPQVFEKYPHLASLQFQELKEEESLREQDEKQLKLLLD